MLILLGASLIATKGYTAPEVAQTYIRARHLCAHLDDPHQRFPVLRGLWIYYLTCAELQTTDELSAQLLSLAQHVQDAAMLVVAHRVVGATLFQRGAVAEAHAHFTQGIACYDAQQHRASALLYGEDAGVICYSLDAWMLWFLGYPDQGKRLNDAAVTLAQQSAHLFSLGFILSFAATFHQMRREVRPAQAYAEAAISLATDQGFPYWRALGSMLRWWVLAQQGQAREGLAQLHEGLKAFRTMGAELWRPYWLAFLAEAQGTLGEPETGLTVLAEALTLADTTGERWYEPELYRLKGVLLLQQSADYQAEAASCFAQAITRAQSQQAKSWELRAATSLARLWQQQGKHDEARQVLGDVYNWFTEGFDTADLKDAKALLDELTEGHL
jgi:predicted ATPase